MDLARDQRGLGQAVLEHVHEVAHAIASEEDLVRRQPQLDLVGGELVDIAVVARVDCRHHLARQVARLGRSHLATFIPKEKGAPAGAPFFNKR